MVTDVGAGLDISVDLAEHHIHIRDARLNGDRSAPRHRLPCIHEQVDHNLIESAGIDLDQREVAV
jgi:hypothetical protein